jgi:hypothetical protein
VTLEDSTGEFPEPLEAPQGAPNVLLVMGDDIGYGPHERVRWASRYPGVRPAGNPGAALHQLPHHGGVRGVAGRAADRAQRPFGGDGAIPEGSIGFPGYNAVIPRSAATVLEILRQNEYGTALVGKSHATPMHEITAAGPFDRWPGGMGA